MPGLLLGWVSCVSILQLPRQVFWGYTLTGRQGQSQRLAQVVLGRGEDLEHKRIYCLTDPGGLRQNGDEEMEESFQGTSQQQGPDRIHGMSWEVRTLSALSAGRSSSRGARLGVAGPGRAQGMEDWKEFLGGGRPESRFATWRCDLGHQSSEVPGFCFHLYRMKKIIPRRIAVGFMDINIQY